MSKLIYPLLCLLFFTQNLDAQVDTVPPVLVCKDINLVFLGATCYLQLFASDLVDTVYDDSQYHEIGMRKKCTGSGFTAQQTIAYTASEQGPQTLEIWGRDSSGNTSHCEIEVNVVDNAGICDPASDIRLRTPKNQGIDSVSTSIRGSNCVGDTIDYKVGYTGGIGSFWFSWDPGNWMTYGGMVPSAGYQYEVVPSRNDRPLNGVTTFDLTLISKHLLGTEPLDSPYKMIAADANQDGKITTFDIVVLRKLILGLTSELPNGKSWRFIPKSYVFPSPNNPFGEVFPEKISVPNTEEYTTGVFNFIGIKIGDLNYSADPD